MIDGHSKVFDGEGVLVGLGAGGVGGAVNGAALEAAAGEEDGEDAGPMVAAGVFVDLGGAAELRGDHDEGGIEETAAVEVADEGGVAFVEGGELALDAGADVDMVIPSAIDEGDEADAAFDEAACHEHAHAGVVAAIFVLDSVGLGLEVEGFAGLLGADQAVGVLVEGVHGVEGVGFFQGTEVGIDGGEDVLALLEALVIDLGGKGEIADAEFYVGGIAAKAEGAEGVAEVAAAGVGIGLGGDADVGREVVGAAKLVGDDAAHGGVLDGGAGLVAGEHLAGAALVGGLAVGDGADDGEFIGDLSGLGEEFVKKDAVELGGDGVEGAADFDGSEGLGVEGFAGGDAAGKEDVDDGFGFGLLGGFGGLETEEVGKGKTEAADEADVEEFAPSDTAEMGGVIVPGDGFEFAHNNGNGGGDGVKIVAIITQGGTAQD